MTTVYTFQGAHIMVGDKSVPRMPGNEGTYMVAAGRTVDDSNMQLITRKQAASILRIARHRGYHIMHGEI